MSQPVIRFENVGKLYRLGTVGTGTLSHDLRRWWITSVMRREDPYLKIGETNDRASKGHSDYVYALRDINLEVNEGDVLGIIGKNGAGKSTLLKLLSRVTAPTTGKIYTRGRIASLLEVGTGFHPELTGRENIYMNGCILGMKRHEIDKKLDEIVDFSGCERYIDTPVKRYSSGMMVRLGFAVAAHLDPEILVVDEVLAVGDAEFQKKAIGKMQDVSRGQGRTVLFVSHNMAAVKQLCKSCILLENGKISLQGNTSDIIYKYLEQQQTQLVDKYDSTIGPAISSDGIDLLQIAIVDINAQEVNRQLLVTDKFGFKIKYRIGDSLYRPDLSFLITTKDGEKVFHSVFKTNNYSKGEKTYIAWIPENLLNNLDYIFTLGITTSNPIKIHFTHSIQFSIFDDLDSPTRKSDYRDIFHGVIRPFIDWTKTE